MGKREKVRGKKRGGKERFMWREPETRRRGLVLELEKVTITVQFAQPSQTNPCVHFSVSFGLLL